jgi:hypothetical protein
VPKLSDAAAIPLSRPVGPGTYGWVAVGEVRAHGLVGKLELELEDGASPVSSEDQTLQTLCRVQRRCCSAQYPQKFNTFNTFNIFTTFAIFAKFAKSANIHPALEHPTLIPRHTPRLRSLSEHRLDVTSPLPAHRAGYPLGGG